MTARKFVDAWLLRATGDEHWRTGYTKFALDTEQLSQLIEEYAEAEVRIEREECAKVCDERSELDTPALERDRESIGAAQCADAIRRRTT